MYFHLEKNELGTDFDPSAPASEYTQRFDSTPVRGTGCPLNSHKFEGVFLFSFPNINVENRG